MNILDIAQNSVSAGAGQIDIALRADTAGKTLALTIADDGCGMDAEMAANVTDPFCTTRTTRKVGLGVPFLKMAAEMTGGALAIDSAPGKGTVVRAMFGLFHIDLMPLGDIGATVSLLVQANPDIDFSFLYSRDGEAFSFTTQEAREMLSGVPLSEPAVAVFIKDYIKEHVTALAPDGYQITADRQDDGTFDGRIL